MIQGKFQNDIDKIHTAEPLAVAEGRLAFKNKVKVGDNPYHEHSELHWLWIKGWTNEGLKKIREKLNI